MEGLCETQLLTDAKLVVDGGRAVDVDVVCIEVVLIVVVFVLVIIVVLIIESH